MVFREGGFRPSFFFYAICNTKINLENAISVYILFIISCRKTSLTVPSSVIYLYDIPTS